MTRESIQPMKPSARGVRTRADSHAHVPIYNCIYHAVEWKGGRRFSVLGRASPRFASKTSTGPERIQSLPRLPLNWPTCTGGIAVVGIVEGVLGVGVLGVGVLGVGGRVGRTAVAGMGRRLETD